MCLRTLDAATDTSEIAKVCITIHLFWWLFTYLFLFILNMLLTTKLVSDSLYYLWNYAASYACPIHPPTIKHRLVLFTFRTNKYFASLNMQAYGGGGSPSSSSFIIRMDEYNQWLSVHSS